MDFSIKKAAELVGDISVSRIRALAPTLPGAIKDGTWRLNYQSIKALKNRNRTAGRPYGWNKRLSPKTICNRRNQHYAPPGTEFFKICANCVDADARQKKWKCNRGGFDIQMRGSCRKFSPMRPIE